MPSQRFWDTIEILRIAKGENIAENNTKYYSSQHQGVKVLLIPKSGRKILFIPTSGKKSTFNPGGKVNYEECKGNKFDQNGIRVGSSHTQELLDLN